MLDLFVKIVDRCVDLLKRKEAADQAAFEKLIEPMMRDFEAVHKDYVETLKLCRQSISDPQLELTKEHPVFQRLVTDSIFSANLRAKLVEESPSTGGNRIRMEEPLRSTGGTAFAEAIVDYLGVVNQEAAQKMGSRRFMMYQGIRPNLVRRLESILALPPEKRREIGVREIDHTVASLQEDYARVVSAHEALKRQLAPPAR